MYENKRCEYCGELFAKNDDVVVCPDCGAPYHRSCWQAHGVCAHEAEHAQEYRFSSPEPVESVPLETEDFVGKIRKEILESKQEKRYCESCGAELLEGDDYCVYCAHRQGDPIRSAKRRHAGKDPLGGMAPDVVIDGEKISDLVLVVRNNAGNILPKLKRISEKKIKLGWSWPAFFFGYLYLFFRKLYKYGLIVILAEIMLFNVLNVAMGDPVSKTLTTASEIYASFETESLSETEYLKLMEQTNERLYQSGLAYRVYAVAGITLAVTNISCALLFHYLYLRHCKDTIKRMRKSAEILGEMSQAEFRLNLLARGGVSIFGLVFGYMANFMLAQIVSYLIEMFSQIGR